MNGSMDEAATIFYLRTRASKLTEMSDPLVGLN